MLVWAWFKKCFVIRVNAFSTWKTRIFAMQFLWSWFRKCFVIRVNAFSTWKTRIFAMQFLSNWLKQGLKNEFFLHSIFLSHLNMKGKNKQGKPFFECQLMTPPLIQNRPLWIPSTSWISELISLFGLYVVNLYSKIFKSEIKSMIQTVYQWSNLVKSTFCFFTF